jgi:DHA2 family multidrug resistance protein
MHNFCKSGGGMVFVGFLMGRGAGARWLVVAGLVVMAAAEYWMARMNLEISPWQVIAPRMLLTLGLGLLFAPISLSAPATRSAPCN